MSLITLSMVAGAVAVCTAGLGMGVTVAGIVVEAGGAPSGTPPGGGPAGGIPAEAASAITEATIRSADDRVGVSPMARSICVR